MQQRAWWSKSAVTHSCCGLSFNRMVQLCKPCTVSSMLLYGRAQNVSLLAHESMPAVLGSRRIDGLKPAIPLVLL